MITIIKHGKNYKRECTCPICECKFAYEEEDTMNSSSYSPENNNFTTYKSVSCPECNKNIIINKSVEPTNPYKLTPYTYEITCDYRSSDANNEEN